MITHSLREFTSLEPNAAACKRRCVADIHSAAGTRHEVRSIELGWQTRPPTYSIEHQHATTHDRDRCARWKREEKA